MARSHVGVCGKICLNCAIFIATTTGDISKKNKLISEVSQIKGKKVKPSAIKCWGCSAPDRNCFNDNCYFRQCAHDRGLEFCYRCPKFPCKKLQEFYETNPVPRENLRQICKIGVEAFFIQNNKHNE
jgi:hypothetical protein